MKEQQIALERRVRPSLLPQGRSCRVRSALEISSSGPVGIALVSGALQASVALAGMQVQVSPGSDRLNEQQLRARFNAQPDDPAWQQCLPMAFVAALWDSDPVAAPGAGKAAGGGSSGKKGRSGPQGPVAQLKAELKRMQSQGTLRAPSAILGRRVRFVPSVVAQALLSATDTASGMGGEGHDASTSAASAALAVAGSVVSSGGGSGGGPFAAEPSAALSAGLVPRLEYLVSRFGCGSIWASWESAASLGAVLPCPSCCVTIAALQGWQMLKRTLQMRVLQGHSKTSLCGRLTSCRTNLPAWQLWMLPLHQCRTSSRIDPCSLSGLRLSCNFQPCSRCPPPLARTVHQNWLLQLGHQHHDGSDRDDVGDDGSDGSDRGARTAAFTGKGAALPLQL